MSIISSVLVIILISIKCSYEQYDDTYNHSRHLLGDAAGDSDELTLQQAGEALKKWLDLAPEGPWPHEDLSSIELGYIDQRLIPDNEYVDTTKFVASIIPHTELRMPLLHRQQYYENIDPAFAALNQISSAHDIGNPKQELINKQKLLFGIYQQRADSEIKRTNTCLYSALPDSLHGTMSWKVPDFYHVDNDHFIQFQNLRPGVAQVIAFSLLSIYGIGDYQYDPFGGEGLAILSKHPSVVTRFGFDVNDDYSPETRANAQGKVNYLISTMLSNTKNYRNCWQYSSDFIDLYVGYYKECESKRPKLYSACILKQLEEVYKEIKHQKQ